MATAVYADRRKAWKLISLSALQNLIRSMPNQLKAVIKNN